MTRAPTVGCLFSGMGGFASGLQEAGFKIVWASDIDADACETFRHRFKGTRVIQESVQHFSVQKYHLASVDVFAAGFPCQSFSQAGNRRGFNDPKGTIFFEIPRILSELAEHQRPRLLLLENVPHLLYGGQGSWFQQICNSIRRSGYWFRRDSCWLVKVHQETSIPQDRQRLFMVAASRHHFSFNPYHPPPSRPTKKNKTQSLNEIIDRSHPASTNDYLPKNTKYYNMISQAMLRGTSRSNIYQLRRSYVREKKGGLCPTLTANMGTGGHNVPFIRDSWGIRRLSVTEVAQLQGFANVENLFPESIPTTQRYRLLGNAVCVNAATRLGEDCGRILRETPWKA